MTIPAYSTTPPDLPSGALCNEDNLNTDTGPVDIEVTWEPNTINTTWYSEGSQVSGPASCTYNAVMTLPSNRPTREGYTFAGWTLRASQCTIPSANLSIDPTHFYAHGQDNGNDYCWIDYGGDATNCASMSDLALNEWKSEYSYGTVRGIASCQPTIPADIAYFTVNGIALLNGQYDPEQFISEYTALAGQEKGAMAQQALQAFAQNDEATAYSLIWQLQSVPGSTNYTTNATGQYCWCKATNYTANGAQQCNIVSSPWSYVGDLENNCLTSCAAGCASQAVTGTRGSFRGVFFGNIQ